VGKQERQCGNCGVDLALAANIETDALSSDVPSAQVIAPEVLIPRLGEYLVARGLLAPEQLQYALRYQKKLAQQGNPLLLGQVLVRMKFVDQQTLDRAVTEQILRLQDALKRANRELGKRVRQRTEQLQRSLARLKELNQLKSNFIANVSHELRTPLTHIKGYIELLTEGAFSPLNHEQAEAMKVLNRATQRLEKLIDDLIKYAEASRGELKLKLEPVAVQVIINQVVARLFSKAEQRRIFVDTQLDANLPVVLADEENITWVLHQLVDNAIKFTQEGGNIIVSARVDEDNVTIAVEDTGIGIATAKLNEAFEAFHQIDGSSTRRYSGTGLGLALVKRIIEAHGSSIEVSSKLGQGSRFAFSLPVAIDSHHLRA
jgi:signal transduction histidine kinase